MAIKAKVTTRFMKDMKNNVIQTYSENVLLANAHILECDIKGCPLPGQMPFYATPEAAVTPKPAEDFPEPTRPDRINNDELPIKIQPTPVTPELFGVIDTLETLEQCESFAQEHFGKKLNHQIKKVETAQSTLKKMLSVHNNPKEG